MRQGSKVALAGRAAFAVTISVRHLSTHVRPSYVSTYPSKQVQRNPPPLSSQLCSQPPFTSEHSGISISHSSPLQPELQAHRPGGMHLPLAHSPLHSNAKSSPTVITIWMYSAAISFEGNCRGMMIEGSAFRKVSQVV
jgi:hypothetical protein